MTFTLIDSGLPEGDWRFPDGSIKHGGATLTIDNLPPMGLLLVAED
jgi:hypothetical protein